jgi:hypothetical protein
MLSLKMAPQKRAETCSCGILSPYLLTPGSRVLLEKLTGLQLVKKFPAFYRTRWFITAFTSAPHLSRLSPCQHRMAGPQVADGGKVSNMEGSCECME